MGNVGIFHSHLLRPFGIFCGHLVYFFRFGMLYQEKFGNPGRIYVPRSQGVSLCLKNKNKKANYAQQYNRRDAIVTHDDRAQFFAGFWSIHFFGFGEVSVSRNGRDSMNAGITMC
jgi:hypothetical protein